MEADYGALNGTVADLVARLNAAGSTVDASMQPVFFIVGCLLLVFACAKFMWQRDLAPLAVFVINFCLLMAVIWLSSRWMPMTQGYMTRMGGYGAALGGSSIDRFTPAAVMVEGLELAQKLYVENVSWMRLVFGTTSDNIANIVMLVVCVLTILVAVAMAVIVMAFWAMMKLASIVAMVFLAFLLFEQTRFMAAPGLARILAYGVQILVMSLIAGLYFATMEGLELDGRLRADQAITVLALVLFFALLFLVSTTIAREQISGMPNLSLNEPAGLMARGAAGAAGMLPGAARATMGAFGGAGGMPSMPRLGGSSPPGGGGSPLGGGAGFSAGGGRAMTMASGAGSGGSGPAAAQRMLARARSPQSGKGTIIDGEWTEARDLGPKAAQRMVAKAREQGRLPPPPRP